MHHRECSSREALDPSAPASLTLSVAWVPKYDGGRQFPKLPVRLGVLKQRLGCERDLSGSRSFNLCLFNSREPDPPGFCCDSGLSTHITTPLPGLYLPSPSVRSYSAMSEPPPTTSGLRLPDALAHALSTFGPPFLNVSLLRLPVLTTLFSSPTAIGSGGSA